MASVYLGRLPHLEDYAALPGRYRGWNLLPFCLFQSNAWGGVLLPSGVFTMTRNLYRYSSTTVIAGRHNFRLFTFPVFRFIYA